MPTSEIEKIPTNQKVNTPESGTYGEKAALQRLEQQLPTSDTSQPQQPQPRPMATQPVVPRTRVPGAAGGPPLPAPLLAPTNRPDVPVDTPLGAGAAPMLTPQQHRLRLLDALAENPNVSDETREWAQMMRDLLTGV